MNLAIRQVLNRQTIRICDKYAYKICANKHSLLSPVHPRVATIIQCKSYCNQMEANKLPPLMEFPPIVWPSFVKFIKNWIFANFIIKPYFEPEFSLNEFIEASKHAVEVVSDALHKSDFKMLDGLVEKEAINSLKTAVSKLSLSQRQMLAIDKEDIFYAFPYQVGVIFDESDKRWVEITMCYHVLKGFKQMQDSGNLPPLSIGDHPEHLDKIFVLNYRFIREFTKGVEDSWWVNIVNHLQPHTFVKRV